MAGKAILREKTGGGPAIFIATLLLALTCLPYLSGYSAQTEGKVFSGAIFNRPDYSVYFASMHAGQQGEWIYQFKFTHEANNSGALTKMFYNFLGQLARWTGLSLTVIFHLARTAAGALCCMSIYILSGYLFPDRRERLLMYCFTLWGAGLGWVQLNLGLIDAEFPMPLDYWLVDGYAYMGFLFFPHFAVVTASLAGMLALLLGYLQRAHVWKIAVAAILAIAILLIQPYAVLLFDLALAGIVFGQWARTRCVPWKTLLAGGWIVLAQLPLLAYNAYLFTQDPLWETFGRQNITTTPPWYYLAWGYFFLWPPALAAIPSLIRALRSGDDESQALIQTAGMAGMLAWTAGALVMAYFPVTIQRRFLQALSLPLAALAVYGWSQVQALRPARDGKRNLPARALLLGTWMFSLIPPLFLIGGYTVFLPSRPEILFDSSEVIAALDWLAHNAGPEERVLAAERTALAIVERTGLPVYYGHKMETLDYAEKSHRAAAFYAGDTHADWLQEARVRWIIYGPHERELGAGGDLLAGPSLQPVYLNGAITIYQLLPP